MANDTFYALSTISGKSGVAVIRLNGPESARVIKDMGYAHPPSPRAATFHKLTTPGRKDVLDEVIFIYFKAPHSFTGDDVLELHLHGSRAVIKDVLSALSRLPYLRIAEPGEFSRQAFMNGKMDLTQAEGLAELIESETSIQRQVALRQMSGEVASLYGQWRQQIVMMLASIEALIDFPGDDIPQSTLALVKHQVDSLVKDIYKHLSASNDLTALTDGIKIVISGPPNAGKSSLMNYIARSEVAIVSDIAGTTRDVISVKFDLAGFPLILTDTAGIRENSSDVIEQKGIIIAKKAAASANINIVVLAANHNNDDFIEENPQLFTEQSIILFNKVDLLSSNQMKDLENNLSRMHKKEMQQCLALLPISIDQNHGIHKLLDTLKEAVAERYTPSAEPLLTKTRYREALEVCLSHLLQVDPYISMLDITAEELRMAAVAIGQITGQVRLDEILDQVFSAFCIGK